MSLNIDPANLRARLRALSPDVLRDLVAAAVAPTSDDAPAPDGSRIIRVPGPGGRILAFRLSADDLNL